MSAAAARSPVVSELTMVKSSPSRYSSDLFSQKIESERPVAVIRTDSSSHVTCTKPTLLFSNMFVPISVAEQYTYSDDELTTFYDYQTLQLLQSSEQRAPVFSETVSIDTSDHQQVAVELLKLKKSTLDVQQKALPQGYKVVADIAGPQTFSDAVDRRVRPSGCRLGNTQEEEVDAGRAAEGSAAGIHDDRGREWAAGLL